MVPPVSRSSGGQKHMFPALLCSICCGTIPSDRHLQLTLIITDQPLAPLTSRFYRWKPFPPPFTLSVGGEPPFPRVTSPLLCRQNSFRFPEASSIGSNGTAGTWRDPGSGVARRWSKSKRCAPRWAPTWFNKDGGVTSALLMWLRKIIRALQSGPDGCREVPPLLISNGLP